MEVYDDLGAFPRKGSPTAAAIGNFDGVHLGHQKILRFLAQYSKETGLISLVLTFSPHPEKVLGKRPIKMIQTLDQRLAEIEKFGLQSVLVLPFNLNFSSLTGPEFIEKIIANSLRAKAVIVGKSFRFGRNRSGHISLLRCLSQRFNYSVHSIPPVVKDGKIVSSSLIRRHLRSGDIESAGDFLGRPYEIIGTVIKGKSRGKALGFPTANIQTANEIVPSGVYISKARIGSKTFPSLTNVGNCPTFGQEETNIESFILNFREDIYGKTLGISLLKKIRPITKFESPESLAKQIQADLKSAKKYFGIQDPQYSQQ